MIEFVDKNYDDRPKNNELNQHAKCLWIVLV